MLKERSRSFMNSRCVKATAAKIALGIDVLPMTRGRPHGLTKCRRVNV